jgi:hypothetical protein
MNNTIINYNEYSYILFYDNFNNIWINYIVDTEGNITSTKFYNSKKEALNNKKYINL